MTYDYLVVGAGPFGAVFAHEAHKRRKSVLVIDRRNHIAGNLYCESKDDINIHVYGAHIFHTSLKHVWDYVNQFAEFNHYVNSPVANYKGEMYNLPFNMNTFSKMWNILTPKEAQDIITKQRAAISGEPKNLEEQAISLVGTDIVDFLKHRNEYESLADKIIYTGPIDEYFGYSEGVLEYRGLHFETERIEEENHQGVAVVNYTEGEIPYTRIIEHKHFEFGTQPVTYVTKEYPKDWKIGEEAYYPVNDVKNLDLYSKYVKKAETISNVIFGGRLGEYKYYDMDKVIASALTLVEKELA